MGYWFSIVCSIGNLVTSSAILGTNKYYVNMDIIIKNHMENVAEVARSSHSDERYLHVSFDPQDFSGSSMRVYRSGIFFW